jgi:hypothetical protein
VFDYLKTVNKYGGTLPPLKLLKRFTDCRGKFGEYLERFKKKCKRKI